MGLTHHTTGVQIIRALGLVQMLLGNMGRPGGGVNAERGHANIQGNTDNAISWEIFPGYLAVPKPGMNTMADYISKVPSKPTSPNAVNYFGTNYKKFLVSILKSWYGDAAQPDNDFRYSWLPKPGKNSSWLTIHDEARSGNLDGLFAAGMSGVNIGPDSSRMSESSGKLKWLVVMDPLLHGHLRVLAAAGRSTPKTIQTEVFFFPCTHWIEKDGSFVNSGRWAQWKWKVLDAPGEVKDDNWILGAAVPAAEGAVHQGGRDASGADPQPQVGLLQPGQPGARRDRPGDQRVRPHHRQAGAGLLRPEGRRHHEFRQLALLRLLSAGGEPDAAPGDDRPDRPRLLPRLGLVVAVQPPHPLQPGVGRRRREAVGRDPPRHQVERHHLGRRRPGLLADIRRRRRARAASS